MLPSRPQKKRIWGNIFQKVLTIRTNTQDKHRLQLYYTPNMEQQKIMEFIAEHDIKIEEIKVEQDWAYYNWVDSLELNSQVQDYKIWSPEMQQINEPLMKIIVPTVELRKDKEVCTCNKNVPVTRGRAQKHKKYCYVLYK